MQREGDYPFRPRPNAKEQFGAIFATAFLLFAWCKSDLFGQTDKLSDGAHTHFSHDAAAVHLDRLFDGPI